MNRTARTLLRPTPGTQPTTSPRRALCLWLGMGMGGLAWGPGRAQPAPSKNKPHAQAMPTPQLNAAGVSAVTLERWCMGCTDEVVLHITAEGRVTRTQTGQARLGTSDRVQSGRIERPAFESLVQQTLALGFLEWAELYSPPDLADGELQVLRLHWGATVRSVSSREQAGPAALQMALQRAWAVVPSAALK